MGSLKKWLFSFIQRFGPLELNQNPKQLLYTLLILGFWLLSTLAIIYGVGHSHAAYAAPGTGASLPGADASGQLEAAGILLKTLDTGIFKWGARLFAGLCIMSSAWALKEQRFGIAIICVVGAIIFGTAPKWVANIFEIGGSGGVFSHVESRTTVASNRIFQHAMRLGDV